VSAAHLHLPDEPRGLDRALAEAGVAEGEPSDGLVFAQRSGGLDAFDEVEDEMVRSFRLTKAAVSAGAPIVYVVCFADLMGQRGALPAMLANGLLSATRSIGMEGQREGRAANAVAYDPGAQPAHVAFWVKSLLESHGVTGEVVSVGPGHLGKVTP
jgi:hypothetical protein